MKQKHKSPPDLHLTAQLISRNLPPDCGEADQTNGARPSAPSGHPDGRQICVQWSSLTDRQVPIADIPTRCTTPHGRER